MHHRRPRVHRDRQQNVGDFVRARAIVCERCEDGGSDLQREWPMPDAGDDDVSERLQRGGNRLFDLHRGNDGVRGHVLRRRSRVLRQRVRGAQHNRPLRQLRRDVQRGSRDGGVHQRDVRGGVVRERFRQL